MAAYSLRTWCLALAVALIVSRTGKAEPTQHDDFTSLPLEDLMNIEVTAVSRSEKSVANTPAAITVITSEDIRRSGATSIPEALRLVPGLSVARVNSTTWAISSRGFNGITANKLLVMIDGRTVYNPGFSGTFWDTQDVMLEDVDRIEVVRGPGGALWGANAVNGVIDVITKSSQDTTSGLIRGGGGSWQPLYSAARLGTKLSPETTFRVYAKGDIVGSGPPVDPKVTRSDEDFNRTQGGFRLDSNHQNTQLTFQGDLYGMHEELQSNQFTYTPPYSQPFETRHDMSGGNLLARARLMDGADSEFTVQSYFDRVNREFYMGGIHVTTWDLDAQHRLRLNPVHELTYGSGIRFMSDSVYSGSSENTFDPNSDNYAIGSVFLQDQITLIPNKLAAVIGSKFLHNNFSGFEYQPSVRLIWTPSTDYTAWGAVSRSVRTPSRFDNDANFIVGVFPSESGAPVQANVRGSSNFQSEEVFSYELGQRLEVNDKLFVDTAVFINQYQNLQTFSSAGVEMTEVDGQPVIRSVEQAGNDASATSGGFELATRWRALDSLKFFGTYTFFHVNTSFSDSVSDTSKYYSEGSNPKNQFTLGSQLNLPYDVNFDTFLRYIDSLSYSPVKSYTELNAQISKRITPSITVSILGQNLLHPDHEEFATLPLYSVETKSPRAVLGKIEYRF